MRLTILMDKPGSWYYPFAKKLQRELSARHTVDFCRKPEEVKQGDCLFLLSVENIVKKSVLAKNRHNIVVHSSALPQGKGWSPLTWQILEGKNDIPSTLFEAVESVDAGPTYLQSAIHFEGHELLDEIHEKQGEGINKMILEFVEKLPHVEGRTQTGEETFYRRRSPKDGELDANKTIAEQFNLLRVSDNEKYPAFFRLHGHTYILKIYKKQK
jgi:methionyl-tRNA formyltransferase